jgi:hypothetical protein
MSGEPTLAEMIAFLEHDIARWQELLAMPPDATPRPPSQETCRRRLTMLRAIADKLREQQGV